MRVKPAYKFNGESYYRLASDDPDVTPFLVVDDRRRVKRTWTHRRTRRDSSSAPVEMVGTLGLPI